MVPILSRTESFSNKLAIVDVSGSYTYNDIWENAQKIAQILREMGIKSKPILMMLPSGFDYVTCLCGIWLSGNMAVPVHISYTDEEINYLAQDTTTPLLIYDESIWKPKNDVSNFNLKYITKTEIKENVKTKSADSDLESFDLSTNALMIYTSGTTGKPKGVVMTHFQIDSQIRSLSLAWEWEESDRILNVLPMHHVHGLINITCCALYNGATVEMFPSFDASQVYHRMCSGELTLFMAVPTIYHKLISYFESLSADQQQQWQEKMSSFRLMVSGSAALPIPVLERWKEISRHTLLERYGMTEIGMALSNPLNGERRAGTVGQPLPFVEVKIMDEDGQEITQSETAGELYVKGPTVFKEYWNRPQATKKAFSDAWFKTGDVVAKSEDGYYKILGRMSSDIIKSGGYKISALEIENQILAHPNVKECAVVSLPDEQWGEVIAAAIIGSVTEEELREWLNKKLANYKQPKRYLFVNELPKNAMGKVMKKEIQKWWNS